LRRDPGAAEEALLSAEAVGRQSMRELRRTVALLRSEEDGGPPPPAPSATEVPALVERARTAGLAVELRVRGDLGQIGPAVGDVVYRVAQEALANAARHAPNARTLIELELTDGRARLEVVTTGGPPRPRSAPPRSGYGVLGMRERVTGVGGEFEAGPTADGWRVVASLPLAADGTAERTP
jgi:signal transduction histidine kinase